MEEREWTYSQFSNGSSSQATTAKPDANDVRYRIEDIQRPEGLTNEDWENWSRNGAQWPALMQEQVERYNRARAAKE